MILSLNNPILLSGILSKSGWSLGSGSQQGNGQARTTPPPPTSKWWRDTQLAFTSRVCKPQPDARVPAQRLSNLLFVAYDKSSPASEETIRTSLKKTKKKCRQGLQVLFHLGMWGHSLQNGIQDCRSQLGLHSGFLRVHICQPPGLSTFF